MLAVDDEELSDEDAGVLSDILGDYLGDLSDEEIDELCDQDDQEEMLRKLLDGESLDETEVDEDSGINPM